MKHTKTFIIKHHNNKFHTGKHLESWMNVCPTRNNMYYDRLRLIALLFSMRSRLITPHISFKSHSTGETRAQVRETWSAHRTKATGNEPIEALNEIIRTGLMNQCWTQSKKAYNIRMPAQKSPKTGNPAGKHETMAFSARLLTEVKVSCLHAFVPDQCSAGTIHGMIAIFIIVSRRWKRLPWYS